MKMVKYQFHSAEISHDGIVELPKNAKIVRLNVVNLMVSKDKIEKHTFIEYLMPLKPES